MESTEQKRVLLTQDIESMKNGQFEEMLLITFYSLSSYFKSLLSFGSNSSVTMDNLNVIKEMFKILKTERLLLNYILNNLNSFEINAATSIVELLDELNDKTVEYYYNVIEDIEDACEMREEHRGIRPRKNFDTLIQATKYQEEIVALSENRENIKNFLGFEKEFWDYISEQEHSVLMDPSTASEISFVNPIYDYDKNIIVIKMLIPEVVDLSTAMLAIKLYQRAYEFYKMIGKDNVPISDDYKSVQERYQKQILAPKIEKNFK